MRRQIRDPDFGVTFDDIWPHKSGDVLLQLITPDGRQMRWGVKAGRSYEPETHPHGHLLTFEQGSGIFHIAGEEVRYTRGMRVMVPGNVPHGLVQVDEPTLIFQQS